MKKLGVFLFLLTVAFPAWSWVYRGQGTAQNPYKVQTYEDLVHVGDFAGPVTLSAPTTLKLLRQDDNIRLYWRAAPDGAKYAFIKVNGLGLDYVDASAGETIISDVEYDDLRDIEVAWMDADGNVGEFATIDMANFGSEITLED